MAALDTDLRRRDQRTNVRANPFWITSAEITKDAADQDVGLFGFTADEGAYFIHDMFFEVIVLFAGGTPSISIGYCTLDDPSVDMEYSDLDVDNYMATGEITEATAGYYPGGAFAIDANGLITGTDWAVARGEGTIAELIIVGADTVMPCVTASVSAALTAGVGRHHMLISRLP